MAVLINLVDGAQEFYVRKEFLLQALADGVNPVRFIHERKPGALVDVWTFYAHEERIREHLTAALEAGADQISSPTAGLLPRFLPTQPRVTAPATTRPRRARRPAPSAPPAARRARPRPAPRRRPG